MGKNITIGIIGLGNAGEPILNNLYRSGSSYDLVAFDIDTTKLDKVPQEVIKAESVRELAQKCKMVITCLPKPEHVLAVVDGEEGLLANASSGMVWVDTSTTNFKQTQELAKKAAANDVSMLEATLTGGVHALQKNNMVCLAGGDADIFKIWKKILQDAIGPVVFLCGEIGAGAIAKVTSNMLAFTNMVAAAECLMIAKRAGLDLQNFFDAIRVSAGNSFAWETVVPHIFNRQYEAGFTMDLACKDMHLCYSLGRDLEVPLELHAQVQQMMNRARLQFGNEEGCYVYPRILEEALGESLAVEGWDDWGYDISSVDGSIVITHHNRPPSKYPQAETVTRDLIVKFLDAFNRHDLEKGMSFFADDCVFLTHAGEKANGSKIKGKEQVREAFDKAFKVMPNAHWKLTDCWIHGDVATVHWLFTGTDVEGKNTEVYGVDILKFDGTKIVEKNAFRKNRIQEN